MLRHPFKRYMPNPESVRSQESLRFLGKLTHDPNFWHLNHHSVSRTMAAGLFVTSIPIPIQMLLVAGLAVWIRSNLPVSVGLVWLTSPITMPPVFYCTYKLSAWLMQVPPRTLPDYPTQEWISQEPSSLRQPLLLGSVVCGIITAVLGYTLMMLYWRRRVQRNWSRRCWQRCERVAVERSA